MCVFYLLFFSIYYKNPDIVGYLRTLISHVKPNAKTHKLLEMIDIHGVEKIRTIGEAVNNYVYHIVFYQAIEDNLRIVSSSILRQMRFI